MKKLKAFVLGLLNMEAVNLRLFDPTNPNTQTTGSQDLTVEMKTFYGDVSTLHGESLEPVDIITFGSPCQDYAEDIVIPKQVLKALQIEGYQ